MQVLKGFPDCLQADICLHLNKNLLSTNPAFKQASPGKHDDYSVVVVKSGRVYDSHLLPNNVTLLEATSRLRSYVRYVSVCCSAVSLMPRCVASVAAMMSMTVMMLLLLCAGRLSKSIVSQVQVDACAAQ